MSESQSPADTLQLTDAQRETYNVLHSMGFNQTKSIDTAQVFGANVEEAINHLLDDNSPINEYNATFDPFDEMNPFERHFLSVTPELKPFLPRISHLSQLFICGFFRDSFSEDSNHKILPVVLQDIMLKYHTLLFIKLQYNFNNNLNDMHYLAFDKDITFKSIALSIEKKEDSELFEEDDADNKERAYPDSVRLYIQSNHWKYIYSNQYKNDNDEMQIIGDTKQIEHEIDDKLSNKWVGFPADFEEIKLNDFDQSINDKTKYITIAVGFHPFERKDTFQANNLIVGDIIDVYSDKHKEWFESFIKTVKDDDIGIHLIGFSSYYDMTIKRNDCEQRGSHTNGPCRDWEKTLHDGCKIDAYDAAYSKWYEADVININFDDNTVRVHYCGYSHNYDETIVLKSGKCEKFRTHTEAISGLSFAPEYNPFPTVQNPFPTFTQ